MTVGEATRLLNGKIERIEDDRKAMAHFSYGTALAFGGFMASMIGGSTAPEIYDIYPEYFPRSDEAEKKMEKSVENFLKFANLHNQKCED